MNDSDLLSRNHALYDDLWSKAWLLEAHHFNTWPLVKQLASEAKSRLEVAPGLRPRLPIENTSFVDISQSALQVLNSRGGLTHKASICKLPFQDQQFDLVCALDIVEHVKDDISAFAELSRVAKDSAYLILSTPLHQECWTPFDDVVGHYRRYEPNRLLTLLDNHGFTVEKSASFGMKPKNSVLVNIGMWFLKHNPTRAMWWYNRLFPFFAKRQKPLELVDGTLDSKNVGEIFLLCKRKNRT